MDIDQRIASLGTCKIDLENVSEIAEKDPVKFTLLRRTGLGASESSVILGVNPFKTLEELAKEKRSADVTEDELRVSSLVNVKKGRDLEPIICAKFNEFSKLEPDQQAYKPQNQYRLNACEGLTTNFDGVACWGEDLIPIEFKFVSTYGDKHWDRTKAITKLSQGVYTGQGVPGKNVQEIIKNTAALSGVPVYYYTQVQQQMMFLKSEFCYIAALFDKDWTLRVFRINANKFVQDQIIEEGNKFYNRHMRM